MNIAMESSSLCEKIR